MSESISATGVITANAQQSGGVLYDDWSYVQQMNYNILEGSSTFFIYALVVALTQYVVTQWILKTTRDSHQQRPKAYLVSCFIVFWILYVLFFNNFLYGLQETETPMFYRIAVPLLVVLGVPFHLLLDRVWTRKQRNSKTDHKEDGGGNIKSAFKYEPTMDNNSNENIGNKNNQDQMEAVELGEALAAPEAASPQTKKEKVDYINNIKIFLTNIVILHHIAVACGADPSADWGGGPIIGNKEDIDPNKNWYFKLLNFFLYHNSAYFMGLFFYYSGFFVPKSFDKKGQRNFLFERVKRLGIPRVVCCFIINPYALSGLQYLLWERNDQANPTFMPPLFRDGPTWFLQQLIVFGILYSCICKRGWSPEMECPTIFGFFFWSLVIGTFSGVTGIFYSSRGYFAVPLFWRNYPQYVFYFFGGCIAQRNDWMTELKTNRSRIGIYVWLVLTFAMKRLTNCLEDALNESAATFFRNLLMQGVMGMGISLGVTVFFMDFVNSSYWCTKFFEKSMYTAYLLQFIPLTFSLRCWFWVLKSTDGVEITTNQDGTISYAYTNLNMILPGFFMVAAITMILLWPLAYGIRSIPGFSKVL